MHFYALLIITIVLSGCSAKQSLELQPTPLIEIHSAFSVENVWNYHLSLTDDKAHGQAQRPILTPASVYVSDDQGVLHAMTAEQGMKEWQLSTGLSLSSGLGYGREKEKDLLLVGSHEGDVLAIDAEDGQIIWHSHVSSEVLAPPVMSDGVVIVRSIDGNLVALDASNGQRLWSYQVQVPTLSLHGISMPLIYQGRVISGLANGRLVALSLKDGQVLWETAVAVAKGRSELERLVDVDANPVQYEHILYAAAFQGRVVAVDMRSGRLLWARELSVYRGLAVDNEALYIVDEDDAVWALSRSTGATLWKQEGLMARALTAPLLTDEHVIVADLEGYVHWLDRRDGRFTARMVVSNKAVMVLQQDDNGALYAVVQDGRLAKLLAAL